MTLACQRRSGVAAGSACVSANVARPSLQPRPCSGRGDNGSLVMQRVPNEAGEVATRLAHVIFQVLEFLWSWSFGQILAMFRLPLNALPLWKQMLFVLVLAALGYMFHRISKDFLKALQSVVSAVVGFGTAIIGMLPQIVWAGLIAFGGAWVITNLSPTWIPIALR